MFDPVAPSTGIRLVARENTMARWPGRGKSHLAHSRKQRVQRAWTRCLFAGIPSVSWSSHPDDAILLFSQRITLVIKVAPQNPATLN